MKSLVRPTLIGKHSTSFAGTKITHHAGEGTVCVAVTWLPDEGMQSFGARERSHRGFSRAYL